MRRDHVKQQASGFALVELMVVLLIIGILVAVAVPVYLSSQSNARMRTCQANLRIIDGAIQSYESDGGTPLASLDDLPPQYLRSVPAEPTGGSYSLVAATEEAPTYAACSAGHTY